MIKKYLGQAIHLLRQNPLFSTFYIVATGLAISMVMILVIIYYIKIADIYPEIYRTRMAIAPTAHMQDIKDHSLNNTWRYSSDFIRKCFSSLKGTEAVSAVKDAESWLVKVNGVKRPFSVWVKATDPEFWKIFGFSFVQGKPFTDADFQSGMHVAVVSEDMARRIFGEIEIVGRHMELNYVDYRVCGVVKSPSYVTKVSYAEVWLPYSSIPSYTIQGASDGDILGPFQAVFLLPSALNIREVRAGVDEYVRKFNEQNQDGSFLLMHGQPYLYWKTLFYTEDMKDLDFLKIFKQIGLWLCMLLLVPALNLSGMISSCMEHRLPEMGVRKAFGATGKQLFSQIMWENLLLTCFGGVLGLLLSFGIILFAKDWLLTILDGGMQSLSDLTQMSLTADMLFSPILFLVTFMVCIVLNVCSALIPAYVTLKKEIVYSLNKQK